MQQERRARQSRFISNWLAVNHFRIILILSLLHIGLASTHAWGSGRADR